MKEVHFSWFVFIVVILLVAFILEAGVLHGRGARMLALLSGLIGVAGILLLLYTNVGTSYPLRNTFLRENQLSAQAEQGMGVYFKYGCPNCHQLEGWGTPAGPDLADVILRDGEDWFREYLVNPGFRSSSSAMPDYSTMAAGELDTLLEFVSIASKVDK